MVKKCIDCGVFDTAPFINQKPMIDYIPQEIIESYRPQGNKGRQTVKYSPT